MTETPNSRTLICSVVFLDIVEYSRQPVVQQIRLKDRFNALLSQALQDIAVTDRIILDTGDGAAISMIGDPEDALFLATKFRDAVAAQAPEDASQFNARIGINLGPVRLVKDINGQPNIIGDGINVAQRVMSFALPGQVLVSRSYYEVVSCLSDEYSKLFVYQGSHTDKHIREHEVYAVGPTVAGLGQRAQTQPGGTRASAAYGRPSANYAAQVTATFRANVSSRPGLATAIAIAAILAAAIVARGLRHPAPAETAAAVPATAPAAATTAPATAPAAAAAAPAPTVAAALSAPPHAGVQRPDKNPAAAERDQRKAKPAAAAAHETARLILAITPWGEVYVDGEKQGVSPPLHELRIAAGEHTIEVKNMNFPSHVETVRAKAGERIRIKYKFH
ncbi:MAG: adenylate/guanylate cyclase domain-containing protein [Burkholderiales bacterium]